MSQSDSDSTVDKFEFLGFFKWKQVKFEGISIFIHMVSMMIVNIGLKKNGFPSGELDSIKTYEARAKWGPFLTFWSDTF